MNFRKRQLEKLLLLGLFPFCAFSLPVNASEVSYYSVQSETYRVSGTVLDSSGEPVIGASVLEKGTTNGTITDFEGKFVLDVTPNSTLVISFIGFADQEFVINKDNLSLSVKMSEDTELIDEVVVVGYGVQKKENLTGSVAAMNFKDVSSMPVANTTNMLQGRLPGVVLTGNGAQAGHDTPEIRVRGVGSISGADNSDKNNPMVLIDGVESTVSQISEIAASDIESVSVLKDAASAAIYGVRAANGVILITTKRGGESKPRITYSGSVSLQQATVLPDFVNSYEWAKMFNECNPAKAYTPEMLQALKDGSDPDRFANTSWVDEVFRTAPMHSHHLSVNGGSEKVHYMLSAQYFKQEGILRNTASDRYNFRSNIDAKLGRVTIGLNLSGSKQHIDEPAMSVGNPMVSGEDGLMRQFTTTSVPSIPVRYSNGEYGHVDGNPYSTSTKNIVELLNHGFKDTDNYRFDGKIWGEVDIIKGLKFRSSLAYKYNMSDYTTFTPKALAWYNADGDIINNAGEQNTLKDYHYIQTGYINENIFTYNNQFGKHAIQTLLGHSVQLSRWDKLNASKQGFPTDNIYEMDGGTQNDKVTGSAEEVALQSFFGRINYNYDGKYLVEVNVRHDGSSRLPSNNRYATFPSFSAAWLMSNEEFLKNVDFLSSLKLRGSWGKLGNQEIGNYAYMESLSAKGNYYFGDKKFVGMKSSKVANENIKWETTTMIDFGVDASFLNGKFNLVFDWYDKTTSDILLELPMPLSYLGVLQAPYQNAGKVRNRGWEFALNYYDGIGDWSWNAGISLSGVKNKIIDMGGVENIGNNVINKEGYAINSYYGLNALGLYRTEDDLNRVNAQGQKIKQYGKEPALGDIMYEDVNNDGDITDEDRVIIGNPFPKLQYSFNLGFTYKDFYLTTFWQGIADVYRFNFESSKIGIGGNRTSRWLDRWSEDNPDASMPAMGRDNINDKYSSFWLCKGDYLRLKNIEIGYTFKNNNFLQKLHVESLRLYLAGSNLLTFTSMENYDPEKASSDMRNDVHPNTKTYSFGVNVNF
jgi:TonB-linked SusC/RagA family outer membrane protein